MALILAELHSSDIWTLKRPHPAARQDPRWRGKDTNRTDNVPTQNVSCLLEMQEKDGAENEGIGRLHPAQLETHPIGKHQSLTLLTIYFVILPESSLA